MYASQALQAVELSLYEGFFCFLGLSWQPNSVNTAASAAYRWLRLAALLQIEKMDRYRDRIPRRARIQLRFACLRLAFS